MTQSEIIEAIKKERGRQDILHPIIAKQTAQQTDLAWIAIMALRQKRINSESEEMGKITWYDVFLEELYEIFAETDPVKIKEEAIQLAALCVRLCESI